MLVLYFLVLTFGYLYFFIFPTKIVPKYFFMISHPVRRCLTISSPVRGTMMLLNSRDGASLYFAADLFFAGEIGQVLTCKYLP